ncbi:STAS domain-containing protein [Bacillus sp. H-16]|uniref:STAS domain-containing protein n=1 Tax=Alteribacter salitolerans TaxID=2912333 RepID=UPI0019640899|nr:STAS domain-containing protein [Alteribacter salitolerans]MBM7097715.1 STAS domain-containing protein [Alteribacter salitolerans]
MHRNNNLYQFLMDNADRITDEWYELASKNSSDGVYASSDPDIIQNIKRQNNEFHKRFFSVFIQSESAFLEEIEEWVHEIAQDEEHHNTPLHLILGEFNRTHEQYGKIIEEFVETVENDHSIHEIIRWYRVLDRMFSEITVWFVEEHTNYSKKRIEAQQELISKLSSPVITLNEEVALLPIVGDIDSARSKIIMEKTLERCSTQGVNYLLMDLSGVVTIDQNVAEELMNLIDALQLIGVSTTLSGMRPEMAQATVKLGLSFGHVSIKPTLAEAIRFREFPLK